MKNNDGCGILIGWISIILLFFHFAGFIPTLIFAGIIILLIYLYKDFQKQESELKENKKYYAGQKPLKSDSRLIKRIIELGILGNFIYLTILIIIVITFIYVPNKYYWVRFASIPIFLLVYVLWFDIETD